MVMPKLKVDYTFTGPLFTGQASELIAPFIKAMEEQVSQHGVDLIRNHDAAHFRYRYPSRHRGQASAAVRSRLVNGHRQIERSRIVYGKWLEGTGSRNATSRFKGYHAFRMIGQQLQDRAVRMAETILQPYLRQMNGR